MQENIQLSPPLTAPLPLVSIVVLTYNSSATVVETLDSLLKQNYLSLEVIVSDDGSKDNTVAVVREWMDSHGSAFERIELVCAASNGGVCSNVAQGYAAARGEWIKPIAGDDMIMPGAIPRYISKALEGDYSLVISQMRTFTPSSENQNVYGKVVPSQATARQIGLPSHHLLKMLRVRNMLPAPAVLLRRADFEMAGGIDRRFFHLDDWPLWVNLLAKGKSFAWLPEPLVAYRVSEATLSASKNSTSANPLFLQDHVTFYQHYQVGRLGPWRRWDRLLEIFRFKLAKGALRRYPRIYLATGVLRFMSPIYVVERLQRRLSGNRDL